MISNWFSHLTQSEIEMNKKTSTFFDDETKVSGDEEESYNES